MIRVHNCRVSYYLLSVTDFQALYLYINEVPSPSMMEFLNVINNVLLPGPGVSLGTNTARINAGQWHGFSWFHPNKNSFRGRLVERWVLHSSRCPVLRPSLLSPIAELFSVSKLCRICTHPVPFFYWVERYLLALNFWKLTKRYRMLCWEASNSRVPAVRNP